MHVEAVFIIGNLTRVSCTILDGTNVMGQMTVLVCVNIVFIMHCTCH